MKSFKEYISEAKNKYSTLKQPLRKKVTSDLSTQKLGNYFREIPFFEIKAVLEKHGLVLIQEDGTKFSGFFTGHEGNAKIEVAFKESYNPETLMYVPIENSLLIISWYRTQNGNFDVNAYLS